MTLKQRVILLAATVLGFLVFTHGCVEAVGMRFYQPAADDSIRTLDIFQANVERIDVAFLGSSRVRRAITVPIVSSELSTELGRDVRAFNFGIQGGTMTSSYVVARDLLDGERAPELVVLGLGARSFNANGPRYPRTVRHLLTPLDLLRPLTMPSGSRGGEMGAVPLVLIRAPASLLQLPRKLLASEEELTSRVLSQGGSIYPPHPAVADLPLPITDAALAALMADGDVEVHRADLNAETARRAAFTRKVLLRSYDPGGRPTRALIALIELLGRRKINLLVVNLPVTPRFSSLAYQTGEYDLYLDHVRRLCAVAEVPFVDLNELPYRPHPYFFLDGDHLRELGASYFSRLIARDVLAGHLGTER